MIMVVMLAKGELGILLFDYNLVLYTCVGFIPAFWINVAFSL
jgi:hypothetical protein